MHEGDLDTPSTLLPIFRGATAIFAMTDFWAPYFEVYDKLKSVDRASGEHAYKVEVQRGRGVVDSVAQVIAEEEEGVG